MRTDLSKCPIDALGAESAITSVRSYGEKYLRKSRNFFKSKKDAQEAHEAIRPNGCGAHAGKRETLSRRVYVSSLYQMIWAAASSLRKWSRPCVDQTTIDVDGNDYTLPRHWLSVQKFDGLTLAAYQSVKEEEEKDDEGDAAGNRLPPVREGDQLRLETIRPEQHFTEPPPRYNQPKQTLVKELERKKALAARLLTPRSFPPSSSVSNVTKDQGRFTPTMLGERVSVLLVKSFEDIFDVGFHRSPGRGTRRNRRGQIALAPGS